VKRKGDIIVGADAKTVMKGIVISCIATVVISALTGILVMREMLPEDGGRYGAVIIVGMSAAIGYIIALGRRKEKRFIIGLCAGAGYFAVLVSCNALFFEGSYQRVGEMVLSVLGTCALLGMVFNRRKSTAKRRRK